MPKNYQNGQKLPIITKMPKNGQKLPKWPKLPKMAKY